MKHIDKFLIAIVVGVIILVVVAFLLVVQQPEPSYQAEDTPEGVIHNYLLALEDEDYERAYGYISPQIENYPATVSDFIHDIETSRWLFYLYGDNPISYQILDSKLFPGQAVVNVEITHFSRGGLLGADSYQTTSTFTLVPAGTSWQITRGGPEFWLDCWHDKDACF